MEIDGADIGATLGTQLTRNITVQTQSAIGLMEHLGSNMMPTKWDIALDDRAGRE